ncbi:nucleotide disphospho-sugar-binding domain-containing protein [Streptomyces sp. KL109B]|uniref:nucleotide disphospho-sugar-binding domain-containing protein n=1 Tax=Streptomyces sp. KL109B TaxID=3045155 RepID=UPI0035578C33
MKILITVPPAFAHINPVIPLAGALQGAGHEVRVATHPERVETVRQLGFSAVSVGTEGFGRVAAPGQQQLYSEVMAALAPEIEGPDTVGRIPAQPVLHAFAYYCSLEPLTPGGRAMVVDLVEFARSWQPDLVLWDTVSFPGAIAARACGAAHARMVWGKDDFGWARLRLAARQQPDPMARMLRPVLAHFGLEYDDELLLGQWVLDNFPAIGLRLPLGLRSLHVRPVPFNGAAVVPEWLHRDPGRRRVALSLGAGIRSFFPDSSVVGLDTLFAAAEELDVEVVATLDEAQLRSVKRLPEHVRTVDYLPLNLLLPTCSALVHHGGGGTFGAAVAHRVPQLVWPERSQYYDDIAGYVERSGAGLAVDRNRASYDVVRKQLARVLDEPAFRTGTEALYRDMLAVPSPADVVPVLEGLTSCHRGHAAPPR